METQKPARQRDQRWKTGTERPRTMGCHGRCDLCAVGQQGRSERESTRHPWSKSGWEFPQPPSNTEPQPQGARRTQAAWVRNSITPAHTVSKLRKIRDRVSPDQSQRETSSPAHGHRQVLQQLLLREQSEVFKALRGEKNPSPKNPIPCKIILQEWRENKDFLRQISTEGNFYQ